MREVNKVSDIEEKKSFLNAYLKAKYDVIRYEEQLDEIRLQRVSPHICYNEIKGSKQKKDLSDYAVKLEEVEQKIIQARYERICVFEDVRMAVEAMSEEKEKTLLTYRYLRNMKWEDIAEKMMFSLQHVHKIHTKAISHFQILK